MWMRRLDKSLSSSVSSLASMASKIQISFLVLGHLLTSTFLSNFPESKSRTLNLYHIHGKSGHVLGTIRAGPCTVKLRPCPRPAALLSLFRLSPRRSLSRLVSTQSNHQRGDHPASHPTLREWGQSVYRAVSQGASLLPASFVTPLSWPSVLLVTRYISSDGLLGTILLLLVTSSYSVLRVWGLALKLVLHAPNFLYFCHSLTVYILGY